jgi:hypothetical protein
MPKRLPRAASIAYNRDVLTIGEFFVVKKVNQLKTWSILLILLLVVMSVSAQTGAFDAPPESGRAFALSLGVAGVQVGEIQQSFGGTIDIDYNPADPRRWARVDNHGILRFVDILNPNIIEGVYTYAPFFDGFAPSEPEANKNFIREVEWSPDGRSLAFRIENASLPDLSQGVWFWQPLMERDSDPSYQLLRPCPGYCDQAGVPSSYPGWRALGIEWSSDSSTLLISVNANEYAGRRALLLRSAQRTNPPPATQTPNFLRYDFGHWSADGQNIIVSGRGPEDTVLFGTIDRSGGNVTVELASEIGMVWVQDAVQQADGSLVMLGSTVSEFSPLQLVKQDGTQLTPPIGTTYPSEVKWSPDRSAVMLRVGDEVYIAQTNGTVYEITDLLADSPNVDWVNGTMPEGFRTLPLSSPIAEGTYVPEVTEAAADSRVFAVGDLLRVNAGTVDIFTEPASDAAIVGTLNTGEELIITDGPLSRADVTWYRVQTLNFTGWINNTSGLIYPES